jgi:hypothetical protein
MRKVLNITALSLFGFFLITRCDYFGDYETMFNGNVEGTILDRATGQPLEDVTVYFDYALEESQTIDGEAYYEHIYAGNTASNSEGKFLIRNLAENREYVIVMRKWPGFEQKGTIIRPNPLQTDHFKYYLDSAVSEVRFEPTSLHFDKATNRHALSVINMRSTPFNWTITQEAPWIHCEPSSETLASNGAQAILISISRDFMDEAVEESTVTFTILSTGEAHIISVTGER